MLLALSGYAKRHEHALLWICDPTHRHAVLSLGHSVLGEIAWQPVTVQSGLHRTFFRKFFREITITFRLLFKARRERSPIVFLSVFPNVLPFILLAHRIFRSVPVHIFLHGELESLVIPEKHAINREGFWVKHALLHFFIGRRPFLYVLGTGIRQRLIRLLPSVPTLAYVRALDHPYPFDRWMPRVRHINAKHRVGFVGVGRRIKGIDAFFQLARSFATEISRGDLEFIVVGGLEKGINPDDTEYVTVLAPHGAGLSTQEYRQHISELNCAVFLSTQNYRLTASGSVFDIINEGIEILSLKSDYLTDLSTYDPEGGIKLFDSLEAIETELRTRVRSGWPELAFKYEKIREIHSKEIDDSQMPLFLT